MDSQAIKLSSVRILLIDDNPYHRAVVIEVLRAAGIEDVVTARNGMEGLEALRRQRPQVVLLDWVMDPIDGPTFTQLARRNENPLIRAIPIIMLTARTRSQDIEEARAVGVDEFLVKPVSPESLIGKLRHVLFRPRRFVDSASYVGPCRRRFVDEHYAGPRRRRGDTSQPRTPIAAAMQDRRAPLNASVERLTRSMAELKAGGGDRRAVMGAAQETAALAEELQDQPLHRGAEALVRYVEATPGLRGDDPVLSTHATALTKLMQTAEEKSVERAAVAQALEQLVERRTTLKRA